jgi:hypothetical protein
MGDVLVFAGVRSDVLGSGGRGVGAGNRGRWSTQVRARRRIRAATPSGERWMWQMSLCDRRQRAATKVVRCGYLDKDGTGRGCFGWRRRQRGFAADRV